MDNKYQSMFEKSNPNFNDPGSIIGALGFAKIEVPVNEIEFELSEVQQTIMEAFTDLR
jgi:hypothetical protein